MTQLRSLLFIPGNRSSMLEKAVGFTPDAYVPDMEDSVPWEEKDSARSVVASFLQRLAEGGRPIIPRVNSLDTGFMESDLEAVVGTSVYGVSVGKVDSAEDIQRISTVIEELEAKAGVEAGRVKLVPWIETAAAIVNTYQICSASPRVVGVAFGAEDFTNDMGIERTDEEAEVAYPRSVICVAARAAGVLALDTPYFAFRDAEGLRQNAKAARGRGFRGKFAIHPSQIEAINEAFSPTPGEIEEAHRVVAAFEEARCEGRGSTSLDGKVVDVPVFRRAQGLLELASDAEDR